MPAFLAGNHFKNSCPDSDLRKKTDFSNKPDLSCLILQIDDDLSHFLLCYFRYYLGLKLLVLWWHIWQLFAQLVMKVLESPISALLQYDLYYVSMTQNFFVGLLICGNSFFYKFDLYFFSILENCVSSVVMKFFVDYHSTTSIWRKL